MKATFIAVAVLRAVAVAAATNEFTLSTNLHDFITARTTTVAAVAMQPYENAIPGTNVSYRMVPIPGGEFLMGSSADETGRNTDEGPQHRVRIEPFWMGACEVTWNEYEIFLFRTRVAFQARFAQARNPYTNALADAVSMPSAPYIDPSMGMGREGFPAINMTQHAANKYCQWLSAQTGHYYRLPTEAEWEYACRAGWTNRYSFGDDEKLLSQYAWLERNSDFKYQKVGRKKPNAWGLYDMHGNVAEWTLDGYSSDAYGTMADGVLAPYIRGTRSYPHVVRGGSWKDAPAQLRSASRQFSDPKWKAADPSIPKSVWHMAEADFVGFRIVRPLRIPSEEEMHRLWNNGVELE